MCFSDQHIFKNLTVASLNLANLSLMKRKQNTAPLQSPQCSRVPPTPLAWIWIILILLVTFTVIILLFTVYKPLILLQQLPTTANNANNANHTINSNYNNNGEEENTVVRGVTQDRQMAIIDADDLIGRSTYLNEPEEDRTRHWLKIIARLDEQEGDVANDPSMIRFRATNDLET
jgi:hypothetical protein